MPFYREVIKQSGTSYLKSSRELRSSVLKELKERAKKNVNSEMNRIFNIRSNNFGCEFEETCVCFYPVPNDGMDMYDAKSNYTAANCCTSWNGDDDCDGVPLEFLDICTECDYFFRYNLNAENDAYCAYFWTTTDMQMYNLIFSAYENGNISGNVVIDKNLPTRSTAVLTVGLSIIAGGFSCGSGPYTESQVQLHLKLVHDNINDPWTTLFGPCLQLSPHINCYNI